MTRPWLVTGAAGFIGAAVCRRLVADGQPVVGVDDLGPAAGPALGRARLALFADHRLATVEHVDVADHAALDRTVRVHRPEVVVHLAARAGVRASRSEPRACVGSNILGFSNVLDVCRDAGVGHLVYASSSSVYGTTAPLPSPEHDPADRPASVYAATKRAGELLAHSYSDLFGLATTGLRLFSAYGPWGRPDMAYYAFATAILDGRPITVHGDGSARRDLTEIADVVESILRVAVRPPPPGEAHTDGAPWRVLNVGTGRSTTVDQLIGMLTDLLGPAARITRGPEQAGDVPATLADTGALERLTGFRPGTPVEEGLARFAKWLLEHKG